MRTSIAYERLEHLIGREVKLLQPIISRIKRLQVDAVFQACLGLKQYITNIDLKDLETAPTPSEVENEISRFF